MNGHLDACGLKNRSVIVTGTSTSMDLDKSDPDRNHKVVLQA